MPLVPATAPLPPGAPGSFAWASPEQLMGERCSYSSDVWSLGVTLWVSVFGCAHCWIMNELGMVNAQQGGAKRAGRQAEPARLPPAHTAALCSCPYPAPAPHLTSPCAPAP